MRIVFLGSDTAISVLKSLCNSKHEVVAVVCQPDKPNGRNNKIKRQISSRNYKEFWRNAIYRFIYSYLKR